MSRVMAVVLAAGKGTRMQSDLPKVLVPACGRALVEYVMDALQQMGVDQSLVVVGYEGQQVRQALSHREQVDFVEQTPQLGTGHAVQVCAPHLRDHHGPLLVLTGDSPMTQPASLRALLDFYQQRRPACILGTLIKDDPGGLGRILRDSNGAFQAIVEEKDATPPQRQIREVNMSTYVFDCQPLLAALDQLTNRNRQKEYYLTDCPGILLSQGFRCMPCRCCSHAKPSASIAWRIFGEWKLNCGGQVWYHDPLQLRGWPTMGTVGLTSHPRGRSEIDTRCAN